MQIKNKTVKNIIKGIENVKGENINIIDFTKLENVDFKYFIICDCQSNIQVNAISNSVKKIVSKELKQSNEVYHKGKKRDGTKRKITSHRALFLQESKDHYWCGWRRKWSKYHNNWNLLEN